MIDLEAHRRSLFGVCYRMTGCAADAEDLVQQTFARALEAPPRDLDRDVRPWLVRVAVNLARDHLRARKRQAYFGPWLPSPVPSSCLDEEVVAYEPEPGPGARYDLVESASFAFLVALEALTPSQRAVLLLRDVFDYSVRETAEALELSEPNVKTTHHRARAAMERYEASPRLTARTAPSRRAQAQAALSALFGALAANDAQALERLLREDVRALNDGAGEYSAARVPVLGRAKVILFHSKLARVQTVLVGFEPVVVNGLPALFLRYRPQRANEAPRVLVRIEVDAEGRIAEIQSILATRKLTALPA